MSIEERAETIYRDAIAIDGLNISNWESPAVYKSLSNGNLTAINATIAVWEGFEETMDHVASWKRRFREMPDTLLPSPSPSTISSRPRKTAQWG